jgi:hypothetical protein
MAREYGRRGYVKKDNYNQPDEMKKVTHKAEDDRNPQKHSEPIKPYLWDDYQEMEYYFSPWNMNLTWGINFDISTPTQVIYTQNPGQGPRFAHCFINQIGPLHCNRSVKARAFVLTGGIKNWSYEVLQGDPEGITDVDNGTTGGFWDYEVHPPPGGWTSFPDPNRHIIRICMEDNAGAVCCEDYRMVCYPEEEEIAPPGCCITGPWLSFDNPSTPNTIVPGGTITLYILDGCPPFNWSTSSTGYTLGSATTTVRNNTLTSAAGTCGIHYDVTADIAVSDTCGSGVTFSIRNTGGHWSNQGSLLTRCTGSCTTCFVFGCVPIGDGTCRWLDGVGPPARTIYDYSADASRRWEITFACMCETKRNLIHWCQGAVNKDNTVLAPPNYQTALSTERVDDYGCGDGGYNGFCVTTAATYADWIC